MTCFLETIFGTKDSKCYSQLQNRYLAFKEPLDSRTRPEEIISTVLDLTSSTQDSSTATTALSTLPLKCGKTFKWPWRGRVNVLKTSEYYDSASK